MKMSVFKPSLRIGTLIFCLIFTIPLIILPLHNVSEREPEQELDAYIFATMFACGAIAVSFELLVVYGPNGISFTIDNNGVTYSDRKKQIFIPWERVTLITVVPDKLFRFKKQCLICFLTIEGIPIGVFSNTDFNENVIGVQYRKGIVPIIKQYTDMPIKFIERIERTDYNHTV